MYKKLLKLGIISGSLFLFSIFLIFYIMPKIVGVQEIRRNPELVKGSIAVIGNVIIKDDNAAFFLLSDSNIKCKEIPIIYKGQKPEAGTEIIAYGYFKKVDRTLNADILWREYFLEANKIKSREDTFSGHLFYAIRQWILDARNWVYKKCGRCKKYSMSISNLL